MYIIHRCSGNAHSAVELLVGYATVQEHYRGQFWREAVCIINVFKFKSLQEKSCNYFQQPPSEEIYKSAVYIFCKSSFRWKYINRKQEKKISQMYPLVFDIFICRPLGPIFLTCLFSQSICVAISIFPLGMIHHTTPCHMYSIYINTGMQLGVRGRSKQSP